jgi:hypothetical protein
MSDERPGDPMLPGGLRPMQGPPSERYRPAPPWADWPDGTLAVDAQGGVRLVERVTDQRGQTTVWLTRFSDEYADTVNEVDEVEHIRGAHYSGDPATTEPVAKLRCPRCGCDDIRGSS